MNVDDEPRDVHTLACAVWQSPDPTADCDCQPGGFAAGGDAWMERLPSGMRPAGGADEWAGRR